MHTAPLLAAVLGAAAAQGGPHCLLVREDFGPLGRIPIRVERVATGLEVPWGLAFLPDRDVLITERPGRIRRIHAGRLEPDPVARVPVAARGEGGLMGIALDPRFSENRRFFLYYTHRDGGRPVNRLAAWILSADGRSAREEKVLLDGIAAERYHDGGRVRVGPDGLLYVGTGDAGRPELARDRSSPNGKILRIAPDGAIPPDNPIAGSAVYVLGLRNVQAFDWLDPRTLIVAEHGPSGELGRTGHDRVEVVHPGDDVGWPEAWGCTTAPGTVMPLLAWVEAVPPGGGALYRGTAIPEWRGSFLVGTLRSRHLHRVVLGPERRLAAHEVYLEGDPPRGLGRLREVVQGPDGALWVTTSNCDGRGRCPDEKDVVARILTR